MKFVGMDLGAEDSPPQDHNIKGDRAMASKTCRNLFTIAAALAATVSAHAQCSTPSWMPFDPSTASFPGVDSWVLDSTMWDPDGAGPQTPVLVIAGGFTVVGDTVASHIATFDPATGVWGNLAGGTGPDEWVGSVATGPNGDLYAVGGTTIGGVPTGGLSRWNGTAWAAVPPTTIDSGYQSITRMANGDIVVTGYIFVSYDPETNETVYEFSMQRWNGTTWTNIPTNMPSDFSEYISTIKGLPNGDLAVGGTFSSVGGTPANNIARFDGSNWFSYGTGVGEIGEQIGAITTLPNGDLIVGGLFTTAGGVPALNVARWDGTAWSNLGAGTDGTDPYGYVGGLTTLANGDVIACGYFNIAGGIEANRVARWNGTEWSALGSGMSGGPTQTATQLPSGDLIVGGLYNKAGGTPAKNIARWNGTSWSALGTGPDAFVYDIMNLPNGDVIVAGQFTTIGGIPANNIARWDGTSWSTFGVGLGVEPATIGSVHAVTRLNNGDIVVGGFFQYAGGVQANNIARWDGTAWSPFGSGMTGGEPIFGSVVSSLATLPNGDLIVGGAFGEADGVPAKFLARWDGSAWSEIGGGVDGAPEIAPTVASLAVLPNGDLIVGGAIDTAGGAPVLGQIVRWDGSAWHNLDTGVDQFLYKVLALPNGDIVAGGRFENAGGVPAKNIARWDGTNWHAFGSGLDGSDGSYALATLPNGDLIAGGRFPAAGGVPVSNIARWDGTAWSDFNGGGTNSVVAVLTVLPNGDLAVGGGFTVTAGIVTPYLARYGCNLCPSDFDGDGFVTGDDFDGYVLAFEAGTSNADFNHDGFVTGDDFDAYVLAFEAGC